jgi:hypothetical protein
MAITKWSISRSEKRHGGLLRPRRERPCRRAADERDELAASQLIEFHSILASQVGLQDNELVGISQEVMELAC